MADLCISFLCVSLLKHDSNFTAEKVQSWPSTESYSRLASRVRIVYKNLSAAGNNNRKGHESGWITFDESELCVQKGEGAHLC